MKHLNPFELDLSGSHLVEASAGTGKTHALTSIYLRAVIELGLMPSQLLVVTFTRAATAELKERVRRRLRSAQLALVGPTAVDDVALQDYLLQLHDRQRAVRHLNLALEGIDEATIFTIHGFCQRITEQHALLSHTRFETELLESLDDLREETLNDALVSELASALPAVLRRFTSRASMLRSAHLVQALHARPGLRILPDVSAQRPVTEAVERFCQAQERARLHFDWDRITQVLSADPGLNRNRVSPRHLPAKMAEMARLLESHADAEPWPEPCVLQYSYLQQCLKNGHERPPEHAFFHACDTLHKAHRDLESILEEEQYALELKCARAAIALEKSRKASLAVQGFDDLLLSVRDALYSPLGQDLADSLRRRYPLALIDEFQDTDPIQYAIFSRIYAEPVLIAANAKADAPAPAKAHVKSKGASLFLIGDPKQSIYSFRGADLHAYLSAAKASHLCRHSLDVNWRSDPGLIGAINALYSHRLAPFLYSEIEVRPIQPRPGAMDRFDDEGQPLTGLTFAFIESEDSATILDRATARRFSATYAALHVQELLSRRVQGCAISPKDIAILTRTNAEANLMQEALRAANLKSALATDTSVFSTPDALQLTLLLRALVYPYDSSIVSSALLTPGFDCSPTQLARLLEDPLAWEQEVEKFVVAHDLLKRHGIFAAAAQLFEAYDVVPHLLQKPAGERRVTNLVQLLEIAGLQQAKQRFSPVSLLRWMQTMLQDPGEVAREARQLRIESDEEAVVITTIHRSKGLEYPFVFCPFLWVDSSSPPRKSSLTIYHDDDSNNWVADLRGSNAPLPALAAARREQEAEALRVIYVALTRAVHGVTVFLPPVKGLQNTAIGGLLCPIEPAGEPALGEFSWLALRRRLEALKSAQNARVRLIGAASTRNTGDFSVPPKPQSLTLNPLSRRLASTWVTSSFSALIAGVPAHSLNTNGEQGKDVDAEPTDNVLSPDTTPPARFAALPPGAESGDTLHKILECIDFATFDPVTDSIVEPLLARLGPEPHNDAARVKQDLQAVLQAPLLANEPTFRLHNVELRCRKSELQFSLGVGFDGQGRVEKHVSARALANVLTPAATGLEASYAESVCHLGFAPLAGYLRGFIDLVFEYAGKTYVVDYKSNSISDGILGFTHDSIARVVASHHYALQAALYSLVMHRYLRWRKPDYDYERDFGGTLIIFIRGVCPTQPPGHAVFFNRAPGSAILALDSLFSTSGAA